MHMTMIISGKSFYLEISLRKILNSFLLKVLAAVLRFLDIFRYLPTRLRRIADHIFEGIRSLAADTDQPTSVGKLLLLILNWWLELFLLLLDCAGITEIYETLADFLKYTSRPLHNWEKELARQVFGNSIHYARVRIDEYAFVGPRQKNLCYVSFYLINSWGSMQNSLLLHELTHVWQYQQMGILYIPRSLNAQFNEVGYNYGGADVLRELRDKKVTLEHFNLEQQADIVSDYYCIKNGAKNEMPIIHSLQQ